MRTVRFLLLAFLLPVLFAACDKTLDVNADWKDITVVYGILDQKQDTTYIKITKAFLGEGDALVFSKIADSSNYPDKLEVRLDEYSGTTFRKSYSCDTVTVRNKQKGDSVFYYPDQLMYFTKALLDEKYTYKLYIRNRVTGKEITSETLLVSDFEVNLPNDQITYPPAGTFRVKWQPAKYGMRYQLLIRFHYLETVKATGESDTLSIDWILFNYIKPSDINSSNGFDLYFPGEAFFTVLGAKIPENPAVGRAALYCDFVFTVAGPDLDTYIEVTEPSLSLVQEKPAYTNINNGIGLFSSRITKQVSPVFISDVTKKELKTNANTNRLGF